MMCSRYEVCVCIYVCMQCCLLVCVSDSHVHNGEED